MILRDRFARCCVSFDGRNAGMFVCPHFGVRAASQRLLTHGSLLIPVGHSGAHHSTFERQRRIGAAYFPLPGQGDIPGAHACNVRAHFCSVTLSKTLIYSAIANCCLPLHAVTGRCGGRCCPWSP